MRLQPNVIYEKTEICFTCCHDQKAHKVPASYLPSPGFIYKERDQSKKLSLRRTQVKQVNLGNKQYQTYSSIFPQSQRESQRKNLFHQRIYSNDNILRFQKSTTELQKLQKFQSNLPYMKGEAYDGKFQLNLGPQSHILTETTKMMRHRPPNNEELSQTHRQQNYCEKITNLQGMKMSVESFAEIYSEKPCFEESQILLDFFNPTQSRLADIKSHLNYGGQL